MAARNDEDDFAESFATYRTDPANLIVLAPDKFDFIDRIFGNLEAAEVAQT